MIRLPDGCTGSLQLFHVLIRLIFVRSGAAMAASACTMPETGFGGTGRVGPDGIGGTGSPVQH